MWILCVVFECIWSPQKVNGKDWLTTCMQNWTLAYSRRAVSVFKGCVIYLYVPCAPYRSTCICQCFIKGFHFACHQYVDVVCLRPCNLEGRITQLTVFWCEGRHAGSVSYRRYCLWLKMRLKGETRNDEVTRGDDGGGARMSVHLSGLK